MVRQASVIDSNTIPSLLRGGGVARAIIIGMFALTGCATNGSTSPTTLICDADANRYDSDTQALAAGLDYPQFGATYCPEYKMHPSWDTNRDGVNDCYDDGSCSADADYQLPRLN